MHFLFRLVDSATSKNVRHLRGMFSYVFPSGTVPNRFTSARMIAVFFNLASTSDFNKTSSFNPARRAIIYSRAFPASPRVRGRVVYGVQSQRQISARQTWLLNVQHPVSSAPSLPILNHPEIDNNIGSGGPLPDGEDAASPQYGRPHRVL